MIQTQFFYKEAESLLEKIAVLVATEKHSDQSVDPSIDEIGKVANFYVGQDAEFQTNDVILDTNETDDEPLQVVNNDMDNKLS